MNKQGNNCLYSVKRMDETCDMFSSILFIAICFNRLIFLFSCLTTYLISLCQQPVLFSLFFYRRCPFLSESLSFLSESSDFLSDDLVVFSLSDFVSFSEALVVVLLEDEECDDQLLE